MSYPTPMDIAQTEDRDSDMSDEGTEHERIFNLGYEAATRNLRDQPQVDVAATVNGDMQRALFSLIEENKALRNRVAELELKIAGICLACEGRAKVPGNPVWDGPRGWKDTWVWCASCDGEGVTDTSDGAT